MFLFINSNINSKNHHVLVLTLLSAICLDPWNIYSFQVSVPGQLFSFSYNFRSIIHQHVYSPPSIGFIFLLRRLLLRQFKISVSPVIPNIYVTGFHNSQYFTWIKLWKTQYHDINQFIRNGYIFQLRLMPTL